jgi:protein ImuA
MSSPQATLIELFPDRATAGAARAFALSSLDPARGPVLWAQDRLTGRETGSPYLPGLPRGLHLIRLDLPKPADVLWAMEQALCCHALGAVLGEIWGDAPIADFTATKRLALRAESQGLPCWLIRRATRPDLSAARERWHIRSAPSQPHPHDDHAPGAPVWHATLFRARSRPPGAWQIGWAPGTGRQVIASPVTMPTAMDQAKTA